MSIERARALRKNATDSERRLWRALRLLRRDGLHFRRQRPIGPCYPDFACHRAKIVIELDGVHHGEPEQMKYDAERTRFLESIGYRVIRYWNSHTFESEDAIASTFSRFCAPTPNYSPRRGRGVVGRDGGKGMRAVSDDA